MRLREARVYHYSAGLPHHVELMSSAAEIRAEIADTVADRTVPKTFVERVAERTQKVALRSKTGDGWTELTWAEWANQACRFAASLTKLGVSRGDRVVLMLRNRPEFYVADMGALLVGATPISIYNSSAPPQVEFLIAHSGAKVALVDDLEFLGRLLKVRAKLTDLQHVAVVDDSNNERPQGVMHYRELLETAPVDLETASQIAQPEDLATVIYTSGTTGNPKGVMIDHRNLAFSSEMGDRIFGQSRVGWREVSYLPMAHIAERITGYYLHISNGWEVSTCPDPLQIGAYLAEVRPNFFFAVPRVWEKFAAAIQAGIAADPAKAEPFGKALEVGWQVSELRAKGEPLPGPLEAAFAQVEPALAGVRAKIGLDQALVAGTGAAPIPFDVLKFWRSLGVPISEVWGLSETTGGMTWSITQPRIGTVGQAMPGAEIKLADDGEVLCRGGNVFRGYLNAPEQTASVMLEDGWFATGDIGQIDEDGYLRIVDRKKELIITAGGKNISPANIESKLKEIPMVGQACVVGDRRKYLSAILVLDPDVTPVWAAKNGIETTDLKALAEHPAVRAAIDEGVAKVNTHFSRVETLKRWAILGEEWLPDSDVLTPTMKLKRRGVLARYGNVIESLYD